MTNANPYIIRRIQLDEWHQAEPAAPENSMRYYCSYWWKKIPLGHLFIEQHERHDGEGWQKRIWEAIAAAIDFYQKKSDVEAGTLYPLFLQRNYAAFNEAMNRLFAGYTDRQLPEIADVSVIICTRNRSRDLHRCLHSLFAQSCLPSEVIVVDNAPTDDSTYSVVKQFPGVIYHKELRPGLSIARNAGVRLAASPVIAFTDDDVVLHPLWVYYVQESFATPQVGAMTGLVIASSLNTESQQLFEKQYSFNRGYCDKLYDKTYFNAGLATGPRVWNIGAGANMAFRRSVFNTAGFFDERLGAGAAGCSEDSELWYRILAREYSIYYNPRAIGFHEHRKEVNALKRQVFSYMRGHAAAALIQQSQIREAGYRRYLYRMIFKSCMPLLIKRFFQPDERKMILIQLHGIFSGILFFVRNKNKPSQTSPF
ncbi:glycosyltransferase [Puia sp.]|jgi:glycosyltransferase involved in cell wall biosynthesis|uniref:glycosyltransferase n=1 Tax=Puia sp. TaxID=2045100 RepID=UPI002F407F20